MAHGAHILLLASPAQGHINPAFQFAKRLIRLGAQVTLTTSVYAQRLMSRSANDTLSEGLNFVPFSDSYDDGFKLGDDFQHFMSEMRKGSSKKLREIIDSNPITCVVYTLTLPWAAEIARSFGIPSAVLWIQPATVLDIYYYYFNGYEKVIRENANDPPGCIDLPCLPQLASCDLPSFFLPSSPPAHKFFLSSFEEQIQVLDAENNPCVLVNTFDELEPEALKAIKQYSCIGVGPLVPSPFLDKKIISNGSSKRDYMKWLNMKPRASVVYISFGSLLVLPRQQMDEIAYGLLASGRPFLWVIRESESGKEKEENALSCMEELKLKGMIVPWCSQLDVLSHSSVGCFITHCGWSSSLESLALGVPVVAFPHFSDQRTIAKLIEDVWNTGVRLRSEKVGDLEIAGREEVKRCIETMMGEGNKSEELRRNIKKWKDSARAAAMDGGSSDVNLKAFLKKVGGF